jgi:hypothetical protein
MLKNSPVYRKGSDHTRCEDSGVDCLAKQDHLLGFVDKYISTEAPSTQNIKAWIRDSKQQALPYA